MTNDNTGPDQGKSQQQRSQEPSLYNLLLLWPPALYALVNFIAPIGPVGAFALLVKVFLPWVALLQLVLGLCLMLSSFDKRRGWIHIWSALLVGLMRDGLFV